MRRSNLRSIVLAGAAYAVIGASTAALAASASSLTMVRNWRLAGWVLSLFVFACHLVTSRRRRDGRGMRAVTVAFAVALGAFVLAVIGPVRTHLAGPHGLRQAVLVLLVWPVAAAVPAFIAAFLGNAVLDRTTDCTRTS
jgi:hypothetical protein